MKTIISFWNKEDHLFSIYDQESDPFKIGDRFWINIFEIFPKTEDDLRKEYNDKFVISIIESNNELRKKLNNKNLKITGKCITLKNDINLMIVIV
jgi:hypothetical protein